MKNTGKNRNMQTSKDTDEGFFMLPTVDFCFKELMQNEKVRQGFIAALLGITPDEVADTILLPTIFEKEEPDAKLGILDVRVLLTNQTQMDLEMQVRYFEYWDERVLFYLGKMFVSQLKAGDAYDKLKKCIHVSILDFEHFPDETCYRKIHLADDTTKEPYSDKLELQILELKKLPASVKTGEDVIRWMRFFNGKRRKEFEEMAKADEYMAEAYQTLRKLSADETKRLEYEAREKALRDYQSQMGSAEKRGIAIGEERGISRINELNRRLIQDGRQEDLQAAACDEELQRKLLEEYKLLTE